MSMEHPMDFVSLRADLSPENQIQNFIAQARMYRYDYLDDLRSDRLTHATPRYHEYKSRVNYFQGVISMLELLLERRYIGDDDLKASIAEFIHHYLRVRPRVYEARYEQEDVNRVNDILDKVIVYLENVKTTEEG